MKRLFTLLLISFAALSCEMIDEKLDDLLDKRDWVVFAEGTELSVDVPSKQTVLNYKFESALDWEVKTEAEWLEINPMSGKAGKDIKIQIKVAKNNDKEGRTGYVDLTLSNDESYRITINQVGEGDENDENDADIPNNQIWYTSIDGEIVEPYNPTAFNLPILSNTYKGYKGVIEFDGDVTMIGYDAFIECDNLTSVTIPNSVTTIGENAFWSCDSLTSVTIGDSVNTIGDYAFAYCSSLTSINIPDSVTTIEMGAFCNCTNLQEFKGELASEDGRGIIIDGVFESFAPAGLTEYTIPNSVTTIGESAFYCCESLTSVNIPNSVTTIGDWAFSCCKSLTSVTIPDSVTTIGESAFYCCESLTSVTIPDSVTEIGFCAFYVCSNLQEFKSKFASEDGRCLIVDGTLNTFAPAGLTEYTIPDSVTKIGDAAFAWCRSLTSVTIPDSVTTIGDDAFSDCSNLESVTIPNSVTTIGDGAFLYCSSLTSVYCKPTTPPARGSYMFGGNAPGRKIYVPMESVEAYKSALYWSEYKSSIVGYNF